MKISDYGFVEVGEWERKNLKNKVNCKLYKYKTERVIYAFVVGDEVKYIGICRGKKTNLKKE